MSQLPRTLGWRDLPLLYRYRREAVSLRAVVRTIGGPGLLSLGWLALFSAGSGVNAVVDETYAKPLVAVAEANTDNLLLEIAYLAPESLLTDVSLNSAVEHLLALPLSHGMRAMTAEAPLDAPWLETLRGAGFQIVERRQIWKVTANAREQALGGWHYPSPEERWRAERLYNNLTPPLVRLARPNPVISPTALVYLEGESVRGLARWVASGNRIWVEPLLDPDIRAPRQVLGALISSLPTGVVFISLPGWQAWVAKSLSELEAEVAETYASLVRWSAKPVEAHDPAAVPATANQVVPNA